MILPSDLYKAFTAMHPDLALTVDESDTRKYLESNPLVADCCDLKYATNLFTNWYLQTV